MLALEGMVPFLLCAIIAILLFGADVTVGLALSAIRWIAIAAFTIFCLAIVVGILKQGVEVALSVCGLIALFWLLLRVTRHLPLTRKQARARHEFVARSALGHPSAVESDH